MLNRYRFTLRLVDELRWILAQFIHQFFQFAHRVSRVGNEPGVLARPPSMNCCMSLSWSVSQLSIRTLILARLSLVCVERCIVATRSGPASSIVACSSVTVVPILFEDRLPIAVVERRWFLPGQQRLRSACRYWPGNGPAVPIFLTEQLVCPVEQLIDFMRDLRPVRQQCRSPGIACRNQRILGSRRRRAASRERPGPTQD